MSGRGRGRRSFTEGDSESDGMNPVLNTMAQLLERLVDQTTNGNGQTSGRIVSRESPHERKSHSQNPLRMLNTLSRVSMRESQIQYLCDPQWFRDTVSRGPTTIVAPKSQFRTCPSDHATIGKSRVAIDPIAMHTSWRSNSDIASVTRVSMTFRVVRTNQYNQDLGLNHSTNGNHLESPNEGSTIDHQVTIYLYAQNIAMFPTNET
ncbi:DNA (cytosine-5)-methyltransferase 1B [Dorcoceras hygrometricum]|uniref:DNA (Cytosine-5)-methyltransferase 1B n=1 Tax=Dorcoceras hygrometricum TaxID=472368 RepID=A0A2Z7BSF3_9LAMI|nr:DNA (cytosine-5)-methyltransferase 1B [Dorcoceras hygrometricum]